MSHIFISYSRRDIELAHKIFDALAANGLDIWIDWRNIPKGEYWEQEIYQGIETADAFLFLLSPSSVASEICTKEIAHAVGNGKRILPIVIHDTDPQAIQPEISKRNWIFCRDGQDDFEKGIEETCKTIHTDYEWLQYHTELQAKALHWEKKKDNSRLLRGRELQEAEQRLVEAGNTKDPQATDLQRQYLFASQRSEEHQRRQITTGLITGLAIMAVLSLVAWGQRNEAKSQQATAQAASTLAIAQEGTAKANEAEAKRQTEIALSRQYAAIAWYYLDGRYDLSALFAVEAIRAAHTEEAVTVLQNGVEQHTNSLFMPGPLQQVTIMEFSRDGRLLVAANCIGDFDERKPFCQKSNVRVWEIPSRQQIGATLSVLGMVNHLLISPDGNTLIAGVCHQQQDANYCNQEVWVWDIPSYNLIQSPLLIGERYPLYMDVNDKNVLAVASCRHQQENETGFSCVKSEISFFDLDSDRFIYKPVLFEQMLGPLAFTADYSLIMSRCPRMNDIDNPCFPYVIQLIDIRTSNQIREPFSLEIDYPLDILAIDFDGIYFSACHESEDLGPCAQPRIWWWDIGYDEPVFYWRPDIMPTSLSMFEYDLLVLSPSAIEVQRLEEARIDFLLNLPPDKYSGMIFNPETATAAVYHKSGIIQLINFGSDDLFGDLMINDDNSEQNLIESACQIAGRNFTQAEWSQYFPEKTYHITCPQWPAGQ